MPRRAECQRCGAVLGRKNKCVDCGMWNMTDEPDTFDDGSILLSDVRSADHDRVPTGEWDYVWGGRQLCARCDKPVRAPEDSGKCNCFGDGVDRTAQPDLIWKYGIVRTSLTLLGGYPGAGKSTILLQLAKGFYNTTKKEALYIAGEEALDEIKARADRVGINIAEQAGIRMVPAMGGTADMGEILMRREPGCMIVDSLQGIVGDNHAAQADLLKVFKKFAVVLKSPAIVISHFTKEGDYAGTMELQHLVDTLLTMAPEEDGTRILDVRKNRNGKAFIQLSFDMTPVGLIARPIEEEQEEVDQEEEGLDDETAQTLAIARTIEQWADEAISGPLRKHLREQAIHIREMAAEAAA